ncbi:MAG: transglycosylase domain-containing protein [Caldilineaceae bacterium]|nr:transglycosylase domain-containing protein [Caldilineaceae bacterium]
MGLSVPRRGLWLSALMMGMMALLAGCSLRGRSLADLPTVPPEVAELSANLDEYLAQYTATYHLRPRPAADPMNASEAYLRQYQPGPLPRIFQTTIIYDRHGARLAEIVDEGYRTWVPLSRISPHVRDAIIATEDSSFYTNPGFDPRRVVGAMMQNAEAGEVVSGASTITMQLARQLFFTPAQRYEQSMDRKAFEALLSQDLTTLFTKDEILEMYLNLVHFGRLAYGIEAAANLYFAKSAADLTPAEATLLAGIPQKPAELDPLTNFDLVKARQRIVLDLMARHGYLTQARADATFAEPITLNPTAEKPPVLAPHFVQYVTAQVNQQLDGVDVRRAGMRIFTTLDLKMQTMAQQIVADQVTQLRPQYNLSNAALVALKPGTAEILTMVGSADFDNPEIDGQVNVAVRLRQPGSAIKPILYTLAADAELLSPATILWDVPVNYKLDKTEEYTPRNYDNEFHGPVTARTALANSYNVPAVKLLDAVSVERMLEGARAMGISSLTRDTSWYGLSLTLGGGEVTLLDLTTAFHTIANAGRYQAPQAILYTTGAPGGQDLNMGNASGEQVISPDSAYVITSILSDNTAREPEFGTNSALKLSRPAAAKTGTTTDYRDNWTEGYTRYLVAGVWAGNSNGAPMRNVTGVTGAAPIWHAFMEGVLADPELLKTLGAPQGGDGWAFIRPSGVISTTITCPPGIRCPETEIFTRGWLDRMGSQGPLGDSIITANMHTVTVDRGNGRRTLGACSADEGETHQLVRMPFGLTRALPGVKDPRVAQIGVTNPLPPFPGSTRVLVGQEVDTLGLALDTDLDSEVLRRIHQEQTQAMRWGGRNNALLYLGPCDQAENVARFMFGDGVRQVAVSGYQPVVESEEPDADALAASPSTMLPARSGGSSSYNVFGVAHDANCGGTQVIGQVMDADGQPVSGIQVNYEDDLGNFSQTTTNNGSFSFPVLAPNQPNTIYISIQGGNGSASVPHLQGGPTSQGCHYVYWRGVD